MKGKKEFEEKFRAILFAYKILANPKLRGEYDDSLYKRLNFKAPVKAPDPPPVEVTPIDKAFEMAEVIKTIHSLVPPEVLQWWKEKFDAKIYDLNVCDGSKCHEWLYFGIDLHKRIFMCQEHKTLHICSPSCWDYTLGENDQVQDFTKICTVYAHAIASEWRKVHGMQHFPASCPNDDCLEFGEERRHVMLCLRHGNVACICTNDQCTNKVLRESKTTLCKISKTLRTTRGPEDAPVIDTTTYDQLLDRKLDVELLGAWDDLYDPHNLKILEQENPNAILQFQPSVSLDAGDLVLMGIVGDTATKNIQESIKSIQQYYLKHTLIDPEGALKKKSRF